VWRLLVLTFLLVGCQTAGVGPRLEGHTVELSSVPFIAQDTDQCGPASLATVLSYAGVPTDLAEARAAVYLPGRKGSVQPEFPAAIRRRGLIPHALPGDFGALRQELESNRPVLVFQNLGVKMLPRWHYAVVVGYDPGADQVILRSGRHRRHIVSRREFLTSWKRGGGWAYSVLRPGEIPASVTAVDYLLAVAELERLGLHAPALESYRAATLRWPGVSAAWLGVGNIHYQRGELEQARLAYRRGLDADPNDLAARNNLAQAVAELGCPDRALALLEGFFDANGSARGLLSETRAEIRAMPDLVGVCETGRTY
jgi:tetratricopeptide (TPR) repeat protein